MLYPSPDDLMLVLWPQLVSYSKQLIALLCVLQYSDKLKVLFVKEEQACPFTFICDGMICSGKYVNYMYKCGHV